MISLNNITDFLITCLEHPRAAGEIFLVSDGIDWSTPDIIHAIADSLDIPARLFPFPVRLLKILGNLLGQGDSIDRLCQSLVVDIGKSQEYLDWRPRQSPDSAIRETIDHYLNN